MHLTVSAADESKASCGICEETVSRGGRSTNSYNTSNLHKHMMTKHPEQYAALQQVEKEQTELLASKKQRQLPKCWRAESRLRSTTLDLDKSIDFSER